MAEESSSPSYQRRQALRQSAAMSPRLVQASRPLSEYFDMAQRLHAAFGGSIEKRQIDAAYVYGLRLASLAIELLPQHPQWKQSFAKEKRRLASQVDQVIEQLEALKKRMDAEELLRQHQQRQEEERQRQLAEERRREEEERIRKQAEAQKRLEDERQRLLLEHRKEQAAALEMKKKEERKQSIEQSAMAKLAALLPRPSADHPPPTKTAPPSKPEPSAAKLPAEPSSGATTSMESNSAVLPTKNEQPHSQPIATDAGSPSSPTTIKRQLTPRSSKEQATIDMLYRAIQSQEKRIAQIERKQIPQLLQLTKEHLKTFRTEEGTSARTITEAKTNPHRRAALQCLARKKKLERQTEAAKAAIFRMETQIFMLENAMEDRQVQETLAEASQAMSDIQKLVGQEVPVEDFAQELAASLAMDSSQIAASALTMDPDEEEDLLEELQELISPPGRVASSTQPSSSPLSEEVAGMLALPPDLTSLPEIPGGTKEAEPSTTADSIRNVLKAVLG
jgi:hypothetical protein